MCAAPLEMNEGTHSGKSTICLKAAVLLDPQTAFTFTFTPGNNKIGIQCICWFYSQGRIRGTLHEEGVCRGAVG